MPIPPHLPKGDQKLDYLKEKQYFGDKELSDEQSERLSLINFHYFLGYARNYAMLHNRGIFTGPRDPQHVFDLIDLDHQVATLLFSWIRRAELGLRNRTIDFFCENGDPTSYLNEDRLIQQRRDYSRRDVISGMLREIFRYGEDYVTDSLEKRESELNETKPGKYDPRSHDLCLLFAQDLPIWATIDCFSLGQLGKFIMSCDADIDEKKRTWRRIAEDLDMRAGVFSTGIESLSTTRNMVCHHARLWMRPASNSPKKPKLFEKQLRSVDSKSQLMAFANVAHFQSGSTKKEAMESILSLVESNKMYLYGISKVTHKDNNIEDR